MIIQITVLINKVKNSIGSLYFYYKNQNHLFFSIRIIYIYNYMYLKKLTFIIIVVKFN